jgi:ribose 5-phosphate isomerase RpiB
MKVGMGADHGGFEMKQQLATLLAKEGFATANDSK